MNRFVLPLGIFVLLAIVLGIAIKHSPEKGIIPSPLIGKAAPQFSLPVLTDTGRTFRSRDLKGRWYVLNVWGTWCYACREEHSALLQIRKITQVPLMRPLRLIGKGVRPSIGACTGLQRPFW
jgi:cytochrome c biogenesis protein CcmG/thiol:disulfide interchange protein DsbE